MSDPYDSWNTTPFDTNAEAADKAIEFDLQIRENGGPSPAELEKQAEEGNK